jgi:4-hydroxy-4-methyl-2-oxoglutarate aldolase
MASTEHDPQQTSTLKLARDRLSTALLSDVLDGLGLIHQIMDRSIRPLDEGLVLCGHARTGNYRDIYHAEHAADPYEPQIRLIDSLQPDEVVVLACGGSGRIQDWGEIFSLAAQMRGAVGCVTDGLMRDVRQIRAMRFPAFCSGYGAMDVRGRGILVSSDVPAHCGGVWVAPGDLVFGDADGVIVVPRNVEEEVVRKALATAELEREILQSLREGERIADVYRRHGTL